MRNLQKAFGSAPASFNLLVEKFMENPHGPAHKKPAAPRAVVCVAAVCVLVLGLGAGLGSLSKHVAASATPLPDTTGQVSAMPGYFTPATPPPLPSPYTPAV